MRLAIIATITKLIAEALATKNEARLSARYFVRNRKMTFQEVLYFCLNPAKECQQVQLNNFFKHIVRTENHMSQQAISKAKNHFDHSPFEKMVRASVQAQYSGAYPLKQYGGFVVFAVDGSIVALPNLPNLRDDFGSSGRGEQSAAAQVSLLYDITNDWIVDAYIGASKGSERAIAVEHIKELKKILPEGIQGLIIFDRGYPSFDLIRTLEENGLFYLMRCKEEWTNAVAQSDSPDAIVRQNNGLDTRVIKFTLPSGQPETLITNLFELPFDEFPALYFMRWPIETKYDIIKNKLALECFSGHTKNAILQDFWACIHLANVIAVAKNEANEKIQARCKMKNNLYQQIANTSQLVASLKEDFVIACRLPPGKQQTRALDAIMCEIAYATSPVRPGRSSPRKAKSRDAKYHHNARPNI